MKVRVPKAFTGRTLNFDEVRSALHSFHPKGVATELPESDYQTVNLLGERIVGVLQREHNRTVGASTDCPL